MYESCLLTNFLGLFKDLLLYLTLLLLNSLLEKLPRKKHFFLRLEIKYQFWEIFQTVGIELISGGGRFLCPQKISPSSYPNSSRSQSVPLLLTSRGLSTATAVLFVYAYHWLQHCVSLLTCVPQVPQQWHKGLVNTLYFIASWMKQQWPDRTDCNPGRILVTCVYALL